MIYHIQYQRCLIAGIISLVSLFLLVDVVLAEEVNVSNTSDFPGSVQLVTEGADGKAVYAHYSFKCCDISDDGSFVFKSDATNLVMPKISNTYRIYFYDNLTKKVLVLPEFGNDRLDGVKITDDKTWIMIQTFDYVTKIDKAFLYNTSTTELIPMVKADGTTLLVGGLDVTADDSVVAFSTPTRLAPADTNSKSDLYLWNRDTKAIYLVSTTANSNSAAGIEGPWRISADDTFVAYIGVGNNFPNCGIRTYDIYRKNIATGDMVCVTAEIPENNQEYFNSFQMSADGNVFVFTAIVTEGVNPRSTNLYLVDLTKGTTPTVLFNREEYNTINHLKLTKDGKNVIYSKELYGKTTELCTYNVQTATHSCIAKPTIVRDGDLWLTSPTGRYSVISSWDHMWIGSTVENRNSNGNYNDLFIWDREGVNNAISGKVTGDNGVAGLAGVILSNGSRERYVTDANGVYTIPYLNAGQLYEITPRLTGKMFFPTSKLETVSVGTSRVDFATFSCPAGKWTANYFPDVDMIQDAAVARCESDIDYYWGSTALVGGDQLPATTFGARWTQTLAIETSGWYRFRAFWDDRFRLTIDGTVRINGWESKAFRDGSVLDYFAAGTHTLSIEYANLAGDAMVDLDWYLCPNGAADCSLDITPRYQTNYLSTAMPAQCANEGLQTVSRWGCALTAVTMALEARGVNITPSELNTWLSENNGYRDTSVPCDGSIRDWQKIPEFVQQYTNGKVRLVWKSTGTPSDVIRTQRQPVVLSVADSSHFILATDVARVGDQDTLGVNDPHHAWACQAVQNPNITGAQSVLSCRTGALRHASTTIEEEIYRGVSSFRGYLATTEERTSSLQIELTGAHAQVINQDDQMTGFNSVTGEFSTGIPGSFYFESAIEPPTIDPPAIPSVTIRRTLYLPEHADGRFRLRIFPQINSASGQTEPIELTVISHDADFATQILELSSSDDEIYNEYEIVVAPANNLEVTPVPLNTTRHIFLPYVER
jgi:hypothetical protein